MTNRPIYREGDRYNKDPTPPLFLDLDLDLDLTIFQNHTNYITKLRDNISTIDQNF